MFLSPPGKYGFAVPSNAKKGGQLNMSRPISVLAATLAAFAVLVTGVAAKKTPQTGDYRGSTKSGVEPFLHDKPPLSFLFKHGKVKQLDVFLPLACGTGGAHDIFDAPFGDSLGKVSAPNGKFKAVEDSDVNTATDPGTAHITGTFKGKIEGKKASGTYKVESVDGSGCSGNGTWKAKLYEG